MWGQKNIISTKFPRQLREEIRSSERLKKEVGTKGRRKDPVASRVKK